MFGGGGYRQPIPLIHPGVTDQSECCKTRNTAVSPVLHRGTVGSAGGPCLQGLQALDDDWLIRDSPELCTWTSVLNWVQH